MSAQRSQVREGNFLKLAFIQPQLTKDSSLEFDWLKLTFLSASSMAAFSEKKEPNEFINNSICFVSICFIKGKTNS